MERKTNDQHTASRFGQAGKQESMLLSLMNENKGKHRKEEVNASRTSNDDELERFRQNILKIHQICTITYKCKNSTSKHAHRCTTRSARGDLGKTIAGG